MLALFVTNEIQKGRRTGTLDVRNPPKGDRSGTISDQIIRVVPPPWKIQSKGGFRE
jgi:hypothetical protein